MATDRSINLTGWSATFAGGTTDMTSMTTEQRIASCFQRIQELESSRANIIECKQQQTVLLLDPRTDPVIKTFAANILQQADEALIQIYNQQEALRRLAEHLQGLLAAFPRR